MSLELQEEVINSHLNTLNDTDLDIFYENCITVHEEKRKALLNSMFKRMEALAEEGGFDGSYLAEEYLYKQANGVFREGDSMLKPKYRNPNNTIEAWTGRGKTPKWMQELISLGASKDDFLIRES